MHSGSYLFKFKASRRVINDQAGLLCSYLFSHLGTLWCRAKTAALPEDPQTYMHRRSLVHTHFPPQTVTFKGITLPGREQKTLLSACCPWTDNCVWFLRFWTLHWEMAWERNVPQITWIGGKWGGGGGWRYIHNVMSQHCRCGLWINVFI